MRIVQGGLVEARSGVLAFQRATVAGRPARGAVPSADNRAVH
jgi:hypothetical protein